MIIRTPKGNRKGSSVRFSSEIVVQFDNDRCAEVSQEVFNVISEREEFEVVDTDLSLENEVTSLEAPSKKLEKKSEKQIEPQETGENEESGERVDVDSIKAELKKKKFNELRSFCKEQEFPAKEWQGKNKSAMIDYIIEKL